MTTEKITIKLYELCEDMDNADYAETKEEDIAQLEEAVYKLKLYARDNKDFEILYKVLEAITERGE